METIGASTASPGRGPPAIEAGDHGRVTTRAWVIDKTSGRPRRRRTKTAPQRKADSKRLPTAYWAAETYVSTDQGLRRVQARGTTRDTAVTELASKLRGPERDLLAQAIAEETGHGSTFTDRSTLGRVLDTWITDPTTTRRRSAGTLARYQHAITRSIKARRIGATTSARSASTDSPRLVTLFLTSLTPCGREDLPRRPPAGAGLRRRQRRPLPQPAQRLLPAVPTHRPRHHRGRQGHHRHYQDPGRPDPRRPPHRRPHPPHRPARPAPLHRRHRLPHQRSHRPDLGTTRPRQRPGDRADQRHHQRRRPTPIPHQDPRRRPPPHPARRRRRHAPHPPRGGETRQPARLPRHPATQHRPHRDPLLDQQHHRPDLNRTRPARPHRHQRTLLPQNGRHRTRQTRIYTPPDRRPTRPRPPIRHPRHLPNPAKTPVPSR